MKTRLPFILCDLLSSITITQLSDAGPYIFARSFRSGMKGNGAYNNRNIIAFSEPPFSTHSPTTTK